MARRSSDSDSLGEAKASLRERVAALRAALDADETGLAGERVMARVVESAEFQNASQVALYAALPDEVPTHPLFRAAREAGKAVLFPRCNSAKQLEFSMVEAWEALARGRFGVLEPPAGQPQTAFEPGDLVIVPGIAFSAHMSRLGRGGGYYDRTFPVGTPAPFLMGVGIEIQLIESLPNGPLDRRMDAVVTEERILR